MHYSPAFHKKGKMFVHIKYNLKEGFKIELSSFIEYTDLSRNSLTNDVPVTVQCLSKWPYRNITLLATVLLTVQTFKNQASPYFQSFNTDVFVEPGELAIKSIFFTCIHVTKT